MSKGWISLHRSIQDHWLFGDAEKLRAWLIILMEVNHSSKKSLIKGKLLTCNRGESLLSHESWVQKFGKGWNRNKVIRLFKLLESDQMITTKNEQVTTHLKVNNYGQYQDLDKSNRTGDDTPNDTGDGTAGEQVTVHQANTKRTGDGTQLNNVNKDNNENNGNNDNHENNETKKPSAQAPKFDFKKSLIDLGVDQDIAKAWIDVRKKKKATNSKIAFDAIAREISKSKYSANDCIEKAVVKSWSGFESSWMQNSRKDLNSGQSVIDEFVRGGVVHEH